MKKAVISAILFLFLLYACATKKEQSTAASEPSAERKTAYSIYLAGGYGDATIDRGYLQQFKEVLKEAPANSSFLFLGDNISSEIKDSLSDQVLLKEQTELVKNYKGRTFFIPGDAEWKYKDSRKGKAIQDFLTGTAENSNTYFPKNGGPLGKVLINENLEIIFIDSQWYITHWDDVNYINENSPDIKTRRRFLEELESMIRDAAFKNVIIAMHHPVFTNGKHGGKYSFNDYLHPLPVVGFGDKAVRKLGGSSPKDIAFSRYRELTSFIAALAKLSNNITLVSGHEASLQYLEGNGIKQIISGSFSKTEAVKLSKEFITAPGGKLSYKGIYSASEKGYAKLNFYDDGSSDVAFYSFDGNTFLYRHGVNKALPVIEAKPGNTILPVFDAVTKAQILSKEETSKSGFYKILWGDHYRDYYAQQVSGKTALLDTLYGGLKILKEGGGHQSQSLRLEDKNGKQFVMRSLHKDALKFLRFKFKGIAFDTDSYANTEAEEMVSDFFTTAHPYAQLAVNDLAEAALVNHSNTKLYYFPKQSGFGGLNDKYGNGLYYIEERPSKGQENFSGYQHTSNDKTGPITDFTGTTEVLEKLRNNDKYSIDKRQYIRSRIFDMLIGDWDRHEDQWRWALRQTGNNSGVYAPIPRDRDAAFSKFDGVSLSVIKRIVPETRFWQSYDDDVADVKWLNSEAYNLDKIFVSDYDAAIWKDEAMSIQAGLNDAVIDKAFLNLPPEMQDKALEAIKTKLKNRLKNLDKTAEEYADFISKKAVIAGTDKKDVFKITRQSQGNTLIEIFSDNAAKPYFSTAVNSDRTCEVWLYGLNGDDDFIVQGEGEKETLIRIIGGYGTDHYTFSGGRRVRIYDYDYEKNMIDGKQPSKKQFSSLYETNNLHFRYFIPSNNILLPVVGFATDDGLFLGAKDIYTYNAFNGSPHKQIHQVFANYYFTYQSAEAGYSGTFFNVFPHINFFADAYFSGAKFSNNFFGSGNETVNNDQTLGKDYNRARTRQTSISAGLEYHKLKLKGLYESYEIEEMDDRFFTAGNVDPAVFQHQNYIGAEASILYKNRDAEDFPTQGLYAQGKAGWKTNTDNSKNNFGFFTAKAGLEDKITKSGNLVFQTVVEGRIIFGDNYYFYHSSFLGGNNGLRGYRNERFSGKNSLYDSSNLKLKVATFRTGLIPIDFGLYGGFDVGRVWIDNDPSRKWHTSQGGGIWFGGLSSMSLQAAYFNSEEGNIVFVGFNFKY